MTEINKKADQAEAALVRDLIKHENELINHRITWLASFQGFLFAALALASNSARGDLVVYALAIVGTFVAISSFLGIRDATLAIRKTRTWWDENRIDTYYGPDVVGLRGQDTSFGPLKPWHFVPWLFAFMWVGIVWFFPPG